MLSQLCPTYGCNVVKSVQQVTTLLNKYIMLWGEVQGIVLGCMQGQIEALHCGFDHDRTLESSWRVMILVMILHLFMKNNIPASCKSSCSMFTLF